MRLLRAILIGLSGLIAVGCGDGGVQSPDFTPELVGIEIVPTAATVAAGRTVQFSAVGTWTLPPGSGADTEQRPVGNVEWTVSNTNATIDDDGLATGEQVGTADITARAEGLESDPSTLTITAAELESIAITPDNPAISLGNSQVLQATGTFSDGSVAPVSVGWTSSAPSVATVAPGPATSTTAQSVAQGTTTITGSTSYTPAGSATPVTIQDTVLVTVGPFQATLVSITVTPSNPTVGLGQTVPFTAAGQCTTAPFSAVTGPCAVPNVVWSVSAPNVATIDASGVATTLATGTTSVIATSGTITGNTTLTVTPPVVTSLVITPPNPSIPLGGTQVFTATAVFSNGVQSPAIVDWTSSNTAVATLAPVDDVNQTTATSVALGTTTITATMVNALSQTITGTTTLTVSSVVLTDLIRVETAAGEPQGRVTPGRAVEFVAIGQFSDGTEAQIDDANITWTTGNAAVATIDANGFATGVAPGTTTVTATRVDLPSDFASTTLTVTDPVCTTPLLDTEGASVTEFTTPLCVGCSVTNEGNIINANTEDFGVVATTVGLLGASAGITATPGPNPSHPSFTVPFAAGNNAGFIIGKPAGTLVTAEVLSQVIVSTLLNGNVQESTSDGGTPLRVDLLGQQLTGAYETALLSFKTSLQYDAIRLTVNSGTATALSDVQVYRACGTAEPPQPAATLLSVSRVAPTTATVSVGATTSFTVFGNFSNGTEAQIPDADLDWSSNSTGVATVNASGVVTGVAAGTATITATLKTGVAPGVTTRSAQTTVTVVGNLCATPITAAAGATVTEAKDPILCLLCTINNSGNVIDNSSTTFGTINVPLGLLGATASVTANSNSVTPFPGTGNAGFLIARPVGELLLAEVLSQIQVSTLRNGVVQQTTGLTIPLRADLLGVDITNNAGSALVTIAPTLPYDALRLTFNSGLLTAGILENLLQTVNVYQACSSVTLPE